MRTTRRRIDAVRRFSRFYTKQIGLLEESLLRSPYTLSEGRVIYELAHAETVTSTRIAAALGVDPGYLSRILRSLARRGVVAKRKSEVDRREVLIELSEKGHEAFHELNEASAGQIRRMLTKLTASEQARVVEAMETIESTLGVGLRPQTRPRFTLRPHRPGDLGWIVQRHGELYAASHGWDASFEAMCAKIAARFITDYDPRFERSWIAEQDGDRVGAVVLVRRSKTIGQLRLLFVDPAARGQGLGARLVSECVAHARHVGYRKMTLFTVRGLEAARRLYEAEGFRLASEEPGSAWGKDHVAQRWDLKL